MTGHGSAAASGMPPFPSFALPSNTHKQHRTPLRSHPRRPSATPHPQVVIPAKAGIQWRLRRGYVPWMPAFAGMTGHGSAAASGMPPFSSFALPSNTHKQHRAPLRSHPRRPSATSHPQVVIPAKAGIQWRLRRGYVPWMPAFAGMTGHGSAAASGMPPFSSFALPSNTHKQHRTPLRSHPRRPSATPHPQVVIPAKAGIQWRLRRSHVRWMPAFAGMTGHGSAAASGMPPFSSFALPANDLTPASPQVVRLAPPTRQSA
ncbi:hypothetical protein EDC25_1176 [Pseudofulvimonas gallinarii]|uniref:Uncharacterized protein n=1 Tax=Pseudofulvimonas gallinarii TaxID=634155 RepID=A0A4R3LEW5_9GAMM|nr:hypothetical protein EDC25_1176 [Pseudofulvimonas gallinarii]